MSQFIKSYFNSMLNMFRTLIHPSSGAYNYFYCITTLVVCWGFSVAGWGGIRVAGWSFSLPHGYHPNQPHLNSNTHRNKNTQRMWWYNRNSRRLLMMDIQGGAKRTHVFEMGISACDFFLWGYLKSKVYVWKPCTVDDLKVSIREEIATVPQEMLVNVMQNFEERLRTCVRQEGRHFSDIIFRNWVINVSNQNCTYYRLFWC